MIILLYGEDTYRSRERLRTLREAFKKKFDPSGLNVIRLDGETLKPEDATRQLSASGFLADKRFVAIENLFSQGKPDVVRAVVECLRGKQFTEDNVFVFWEGTDMDLPAEKKNALKKGKRASGSDWAWNEILSLGKQERFAPLEGAKLDAWIIAEAKRHGGAIEPVAAQAFAAIVGSDLWRAHNELEKLLHASTGAAVTLADVEQMLTAPLEENIFRFLDALAEKNAAMALKLLEEHFLAGTDPQYLLRMLQWQFRNLLAVRWSLDHGVQPRSLAKQLRLHPFVAQKTADRARAFSFETLRALYDDLILMDEVLKTRRGSSRVPFTLFVANATGAFAQSV